MKIIKRFNEIDILKSIGIILMIMGHIGFGNNFDYYIHSFHMPMFFIISGFLYKKSSLSIKEFILKKGKSLLIPYILFALFNLLMLLVIEGTFEIYYLKNIFSYNTDSLAIAGSLWFLTSLFFVDLFYYLIDRIKDSLIKYIVIIIITLAGCIIPSYIRFPLALDTSMMGVGLYAIGVLSRNFIISSKHNIFVGGIAILVGSWLTFVNGYINVRIGLYSNIILFFVVAILMTYGLYVLCFYLNKIDTFLIKELKFIGRNSLVYVCLNQLTIFIISKSGLLSFANNSIGLWMYRLIVLIMTIIIIHLLTMLLNTKGLRWILGK